MRHEIENWSILKILQCPVKVWNCDIIVDWADPQEEPDSETMSQVQIEIDNWDQF